MGVAEMFPSSMARGVQRRRSHIMRRMLWNQVEVQVTLSESDVSGWLAIEVQSKACTKLHFGFISPLQNGPVIVLVNEKSVTAPVIR